MNPDLKKFEELLKTDSAFQEKVRSALKNYNGDFADQKAVFEAAILPVAKEAGLSAAFEEYQAYMAQIRNQASKDDTVLSQEELSQVSGGAKGFIASACYGFGVGIGGDNEDNFCLIIGTGTPSACAGSGSTVDNPEKNN